MKRNNLSVRVCTNICSVTTGRKKELRIDINNVFNMNKLPITLTHYIRIVDFKDIFSVPIKRTIQFIVILWYSETKEIVTNTDI